MSLKYETQLINLHKNEQQPLIERKKHKHVFYNEYFIKEGVVIVIISYKNRSTLMYVDVSN